MFVPEDFTHPVTDNFKSRDASTSKKLRKIKKQLEKS